MEYCMPQRPEMKWEENAHRTPPLKSAAPGQWGPRRRTARPRRANWAPGAAPRTPDRRPKQCCAALLSKWPAAPSARSQHGAASRRRRPRAAQQNPIALGAAGIVQPCRPGAAPRRTELELGLILSPLQLLGGMGLCNLHRHLQAGKGRQGGSEAGGGEGLSRDEGAGEGHGPAWGPCCCLPACQPVCPPAGPLHAQRVGCCAAWAAAPGQRRPQRKPQSWP